MKVGVLGGGQLGKMLAESGTPLGHEFLLYDPNEDACGKSAAEVFHGEYDDEAQLKEFAERVDVVSYEFENINADGVEFVSSITPVYPSIDALRATQDRTKEKELCEKLQIETADYRIVNIVDDLDKATSELGYPCILKTTRMGYDGKGQVFLTSESDLAAAKELASKQQCILEKCIDFEREVSIISTRGQDGSIVYYPLTENVHREGILHTSKAPAQADEAVVLSAQSIAKKILEHFNYVGTMAVEMFDTGGKLLLNEIAPRVHNSGHWTIEGAKTSQFENHIRAITGMELGATDTLGQSVMTNIIGEVPDLSEYEKNEHAHIHLYGKEERPKRKIGHITEYILF